MKIVLQRVKQSSIDVNGKKIAFIGKGFLVLVGIEKGDTITTIEEAARKISKLRIFEDDNGKMNLDIRQASGAILSVSQFTLLGDASKGNRPGFDSAEIPEKAEELWNKFNDAIEGLGIPLKKGVFGAHMEVNIINDGPVTFILDPRSRVAK